VKTKNHIAQELIQELSTRFQFSDASTLKFMVAGIIAELYILLKGGTGTGKSTISKAIAEFFGNAACDLSADNEGNLVEGGNGYRVQGTIGTQSASFLGGLDVAKMTQGLRQVVFRKFLSFPIRFIDEAGRFNPYVWADLAQVLAEQEVTIEGVTMRLPRRGVFLFTMNPPSPRDPANIDLPPFAYSRIDMKLSLPAPSVSGNRKIIRRQGVNHNPMPRNYTPADLHSIWDEVKTIELDLSAEIALAAMVRSTSYCEKGGIGADKNQVIESGSFPSACGNCDHAKGSMVCSQSTPLDSRVIDSCIGLAQALCYIDGRTTVTEKDILAAMPAVSEHRLFFPNTQVVNRETHTKEFVNKMYGAAAMCIEIAKNPAKVTKKRLEEIRAQKNPLVNEIIDDFEADIKAAGKAIRIKLGTMTSGELKSAKENLDAADAKLVEQMITLRQNVSFKVKGDMDDPFIREMLCSPEGEPFIPDDENWNGLMEDGLALNSMEGTRITCETGGTFSVEFISPEEADIFRTKMAGQDVELLDPYGPIRKELTKADIVSAPATPAAPTKPLVTGFTADQGKLF
jgi:MoxR-like ATPase